MKHELKTDHAVFVNVISGCKTFEIRRNDRDFQIGDSLLLRETRYSGTQMRDEGKPLEYTGWELLVCVLGIMRGPIYGLQDGWCIMSIERMEGK